MAAPFNDIPITNPPAIDRRGTQSAVLTGTGAKFGSVVVWDTGTNNFRDVKLPAAALATAVAGVVVDHGDPNNSDQFAAGSEVAVCYEGVVEVLLVASGTATKGTPAVVADTAGAVRAWSSDTKPFDVVGTFMQTKTAGAAAELVSVRLNITRVFA